MTMSFDRTIYFDHIRDSLFGAMSKQQVDGQEFILSAWEDKVPDHDMRWLSYFLATAYHETAATMWPVEEYGKGAGMEYGKPDPETGQAYYGRGFVQLTWRENYARADKECGFSGDASCEWHAGNALDPYTAAYVGYVGMVQGWFRSDSKGPQNFARYFGAIADDPYNAREIINGDKATVPSWSGGTSIGKLVEGYHDAFLDALEAAWTDMPEPAPVPEPEPEPDDVAEVLVEWTTSPDGTVAMTMTPGVGVKVTMVVNGVPL